MLKKVCFLFILFLIAGLFYSCNLNDSGCGPFIDTFFVDDFSVSANSFQFDSTTSSGVRFDELNDNKLSYNHFAIRMIPIQTSVTDMPVRNFKHFFISEAVACSPPIPVSAESIREIKIFSDQPFSDDTGPESDLSVFFDVIAIYPSRGVVTMSLPDFLSEEQPIPNILAFILNKAPKVENEHQFTVQYSQFGRELTEFTFEIDSVTILADE